MHTIVLDGVPYKLVPLDDDDNSKLEFPKRWEPEVGQSYWYVDNDGDVCETHWAESDSHFLSHFNVFFREEDAYSAAFAVKACLAVVTACRTVEPDFSEESDALYYPAWDTNFTAWKVQTANELDTSPAYVSTYDNCQIVCELLNDWYLK